MGENAEEQTEEGLPDLQHQVEALLSDAPPETLQRILQMLKEKEKEKRG
jgi:hypothetical protein